MQTSSGLESVHIELHRHQAQTTHHGLGLDLSK